MKMIKMANNKYSSRTGNNPAGRSIIGNKDDHSRHALVISSMFLLLIFFLLSLVAGYGLAQECDGTQWKTDNRGLVFVPKGQKETLLIGGVWYECWGCGDCLPVSGQAQQPRPTVQPRRPRQELSDEEIIALIERTKELTGQVKAVDEVRALAESKAFQERLFLLSRDLKNLQNESIAQYEGLKLKLHDLADRATTIKEIGNIARWSLEAALDGFYGTREKAGWGFDQWGSSKGVWDFNQFSPEVPVPETRNPQFVAFKYIAEWASDMYTKLLRLQERKAETEKKGRELKTRRMSEYEPPPLSTRLTEEQKKKQENLADLEKQAQALLKEAEQMASTALEYVEEVSEMQKEFFQLVNDPSKSQSFLNRHLGRK